MSPFDFRSPVREKSHLAGRSRELKSLEQTFKATIASQGTHVLVEGGERMGKTSMLNGAEELALEHQLLPVRLDLSPALFDSDSGLFTALIDALVLALSNSYEINSPSGRYCAGHATFGREEQKPPSLDEPIFSSTEHGPVNPPRLRADIEKAVSLALEVGHQGFALLVDDAHFLLEDGDFATIDLFDSLLRRNSRWVAILAGLSGTGEMMTEHSVSFRRRFRTLQLASLPIPDGVHELIASAVGGSVPETELTTVFDIWLLSRLGDPYWLNVALHVVWDLNRGKGFKLSTHAIKSIVRQQATESSDDETVDGSLAQIAEIDEMRDDLVISASRLAPYEAMTVPEYVLALRSDELKDGISPPVSFEAAVDSAEETMSELEAAGLIEKNEDRFRVSGTDAVRVYLRYLAADRQDSEVSTAFGHSSYGTAAAPAWLERLALELDGVISHHGQIATILSSSDSPDTHSELGKVFRDLQDAVERRDPVGISGSGLVPASIGLAGEGIEVSREHGLSYVGIVFAVGVDSEFSLETSRVACGWLRWNTKELGEVKCESAVRVWLDEHEEELSEYRLRPVEVFAGSIEQDISDQTVTLMAPMSVPEVIIDLFQANKLGIAASYLSQAVQAFEKGLADSSLPWRYQSSLIDAYTRYGFISALLKRKDDAQVALSRALDLCEEDDFSDETERALLRYNLGYIRALRTEFGAAARLTKSAAATFEGAPPRPVFLLLYLPSPPSWSAPDSTWNTAAVEAVDLLGVIGVQARCYEALAGEYDESEFLSAISNLADYGPAGHRLVAWTLISRFGSPSEAAKFLNGAISLGSETEAQSVKGELAFCERLGREGA